jgi:hypothetical protein
MTVDGEFIPGECKLRAGGLTPGSLEKLDALAERLSSPWSFVATPTWADESLGWREVSRQLPNPPRFALTSEHLLALEVSQSVPLGQHPLPFLQFSAEEKAEADRSWRELVLGAIDPTTGRLDLESRRAQLYREWAEGRRLGPLPWWQISGRRDDGTTAQVQAGQSEASSGNENAP